MTTCACCGQPLGSPVRVTVQVDDDLLALCNAAHDIAARQASQHVEVPHLLWCLAGGAAPGAALDDLADAARRWLSGLPTGGPGSRPLASDDLKTVLARAQQIAEQGSRIFATPEDVLQAVLYGSWDLKSAAFAQRGDPRPRTGETHWRREPEEDAHPRPERKSAMSQPAPRPAATPRDATVRGFPAGTRDHQRATGGSWPPPRTADDRVGVPALAALAERLDRQERLIAELKIRQAGHDAAASRAAQADRVRADSGGVAAEAGAVDEDARIRGIRRSRLRQRLRRRRWRSRARAGRGMELDFDRADARDPVAIDPIIELDDSPDCAPDCANDIDAAEELSGSGERLKRFYLTPRDDIVQAPSIGPRTAARLAGAGLLRVRDLLDCNPEQVAKTVAYRSITAQRIRDWQAQARLVCTLPWLRGTHAQLLVGAGYDKLETIVHANPAAVCAAILKFSTTRDGQSVLRAAQPPDMERIARWVEHAALGEPARAA